MSWSFWIVILQGLDLLTTLIGVARGIPEGNPLIAGLVREFGPLAFVGSKLFILFVLLGLLAELRPRYRVWPFALAIVALSLVAVVNNTAMLWG